MLLPGCCCRHIGCLMWCWSNDWHDFFFYSIHCMALSFPASTVTNRLLFTYLFWLQASVICQQSTHIISCFYFLYLTTTLSDFGEMRQLINRSGRIFPETILQENPLILKPQRPVPRIRKHSAMSWTAITLSAPIVFTPKCRHSWGPLADTSCYKVTARRKRCRQPHSDDTGFRIPQPLNQSHIYAAAHTTDSPCCKPFFHAIKQ